MQDFCAPFRGKKITVLGLGLLGRGVGDVEFLAKCGAHVLVTDKKTPEELAPSIEKLRKYENVEFHLGEHNANDFINADLVIKGAKVPLGSPYIAAARDAGVPVAMSTALFAKYTQETGAVIIGVTGTRGKTTVASMIHHVLISAFASAKGGSASGGKTSADRRAPNAVLGGNIRGISTLAMLPDVKKDTIAVLELDSWQLQGFGDMKMSPHIAVFTNLFPDHLDYYGSTSLTTGGSTSLTTGGSTSLTTGAAMGAYFEDKANIFKYQKAGDTLIAGEQIADQISAASPPVTPIKPSHEMQLKLKVIGEHNRENASFAAAALKAIGLSVSEIKAGLESFEPVEGRLQFVREINGIKIYNDNNSTIPEATIAALRALGSSGKNVILIMGGDDKFLDMSQLIAEIPKWCRAVVLFKERGTNRIRDEIFALRPQGLEVREEDGLPATVGRAISLARKGDTILYSPAFQSFGKYFKNEYDRNDQFLRLVRDL